MLGLLFAALVQCSETVSLLRRTLPADKPHAVQPVEAPPMHTVLAKSSSVTHGNASLGANATQPFHLSSYGPAIGKVFSLYYSTASGQKVTEIEARAYQALTEAPSDPIAFDPVTGASLARGTCKLRLTSANYATAARKYNLRLAEVAICELFVDSPCGPNAEGCEIEMFAPLPYDSDQEYLTGAAMALTAHSLLCEQRVESWQSDSCALVRNEAAVAAGLQQSSSGIKLRPIPGALTDMKMDATYELGFQEAVFATANTQDYEDSTHYRTKDDVTAWQRAPPEAVFCEGLSCLVNKFQTR